MGESWNRVGQSNVGGFLSLDGDSLEVTHDIFVQRSVCPAV